MAEFHNGNLLMYIRPTNYSSLLVIVLFINFNGQALFCFEVNPRHSLFRSEHTCFLRNHVACH